MARYGNLDEVLENVKNKRLIFEESTPIEEAIAEQVSVFEEAIEDATTADVVEVVRCKKCAYWDSGSGCTTGRCESPRNGLFYEYTDEDDFCSYGERRAEDEAGKS